MSDYSLDRCTLYTASSRYNATLLFSSEYQNVAYTNQQGPKAKKMCKDLSFLLKLNVRYIQKCHPIWLSRYVHCCLGFLRIIWHSATQPTSRRLNFLYFDSFSLYLSYGMFEVSIDICFHCFDTKLTCVVLNENAPKIN